MMLALMLRTSNSEMMATTSEAIDAQEEIWKRRSAGMARSVVKAEALLFYGAAVPALRGIRSSG